MTFRLSLILLLLPFITFAQRAVPEHGGRWVHDEANILSASAVAELEMILKAERDSTSNQIAVLIVPSLDGDALEDYTLRVAEAWKIGQESKDNGALLFISMNDKLMRIEVGSGLEGVLTDAMSSRINRNEIAPRFRQGDFDGGVKAGVIGIMQAVKGEYKNDEPPKRKKKRSSSLFTLVMIIIAIIVMSRRRGGGGGGGYWSSGGGFIGPMGGFGSSSGSWGSGSDFGGGGGFGGGGSSDSW